MDARPTRGTSKHHRGQLRFILIFTLRPQDSEGGLTMTKEGGVKGAATPRIKLHRGSQGRLGFNRASSPPSKSSRSRPLFGTEYCTLYKIIMCRYGW